MIAEPQEAKWDGVAPARQSAWIWPRWACTARIAGAYFDPMDTETEIDARLDALLAQHVSVVLADSPWGQQYEVWVEDDRFHAVCALIATVVREAHARGLKIVLYQTGLELLANEGRNPGLERPQWAQRSLDGRPVLFDDVTTEEQHWLSEGIWDFWLTPCDSGLPGSFRELSLSRVREMAATGIDGLWVDEVYLQSSVGHHHELWPSADACSAAAFRAATGLPMPAAANWDDPVFRRWVIWRHSQIRDFLLAVKEAARAINPGLVFFNENSNLDTGRATYVANDPTAYRTDEDMSTGHEVEVVGFRMDAGQTGMQTAGLDQWLSFRTMIAFARAADRGKPSWILTYGCAPDDSARLAGMVLAEGACFYETKGPQMAGTAGERYRAGLFRWIAEHEAILFDGESAAEVGLLYSPRTRDLVDTTSGQPYDTADSTHFAAYRMAANLLHRSHIPFDVVIDTDVAAFGRYRVLVAPEVQAMSDHTAAALREFAGRLVVVGDSGVTDEWLNPRATAALDGAACHHLARIGPELALLADTGLLVWPALGRPLPDLQISLRRWPGGCSLVLVNTAPDPAPAFQVSLRLRRAERAVAARLTAPGLPRLSRRGRGSGPGEEPGGMPVSFRTRREGVTLDVPAGIAAFALIAITLRSDAQAGMLR